MMPSTSFRTPSLTLEDKRSWLIAGLLLHCVVTLTCLHARWRQVGVLVFQFAIQSDASPLPVVGQQGKQCVDLLKGGTRCHRIPTFKGQTDVGADSQEINWWWTSTVVFKCAPSETKTLSRLERVEMETQPRHLGFKTETVYFKEKNVSFL